MLSYFCIYNYVSFFVMLSNMVYNNNFRPSVRPYHDITRGNVEMEVPTPLSVNVYQMFASFLTNGNLGSLESIDTIGL